MVSQTGRNRSAATCTTVVLKLQHRAAINVEHCQLAQPACWERSSCPPATSAGPQFRAPAPHTTCSATCRGRRAPHSVPTPPAAVQRGQREAPRGCLCKCTANIMLQSSHSVRSSRTSVSRPLCATAAAVKRHGPPQLCALTARPGASLCGWPARAPLRTLPARCCTPLSAGLRGSRK